MSSRFNTNNSSLLRRATRVSHQRITCCPPTSSTVISTVALKAAMASSIASASPVAPSAGISTSSGTTARSWNSKTPMTRLPCSDSSSSRSTISLTTIAVLLMASALDKASAVCQFMAQKRGNNQASASVPSVPLSMVMDTWNRPSPNTWLRMERNLARLNSRPITNIRKTIACRRFRLNSRPMVNIRKTTPNSPRWRIPSEFSASAIAFGPMTTPTAR